MMAEQWPYREDVGCLNVCVNTDHFHKQTINGWPLLKLQLQY